MDWLKFNDTYIAWIGLIFSITGTFLNAAQIRFCFILWGISNVLLVYFSFTIQSVPVICLFIYNFIMCVWGWFKWGKKKPDEKIQNFKRIFCEKLQRIVPVGILIPHLNRLPEEVLLKPYDTDDKKILVIEKIIQDILIDYMESDISSKQYMICINTMKKHIKEILNIDIDIEFWRVKTKDTDYGPWVWSYKFES